MTDRRLLVLPSEFGEQHAEIPQHIEGVLTKHSIIGLVGPSGHGKSFVAISMACAMASRLPWFGRATDAKGVLYICGEGFAGVGNRMLSWALEHDFSLERLDSRLAICKVPMDISDAEMLQAADRELATVGIAPDVVFIDTLSSNAPPGFNENDSASMKLYMDFARQLRDAWQCTVIIVHHMGHDAQRERGSSDFRATCDMMFFVKTEGERRRISHEKERDLPKLPNIEFELKTVGYSAVAVPVVGADNPNAIGPSHRQVLRTLAEVGLGEAVRATDLRTRTGHPQSTFFRLVGDLQRGGFVLKSTDGYTLTRGGQDLLNGNSHGSPTILPRDSHETPKPLSWDSHHSRPPKGGSVGVGDGRSHGSAMGVPRESGPGLLDYPWPDDLGQPKV